MSRLSKWSRRRGFGLAALCAAALTVVGARAEAGPKLGLEGDFALPLSVNGASEGAGGAARLGYDLSLPLIHVMPEAGLGFHKLSGAAGPSIFRGFVGGRAGFGAGVRFDGFVHIGYGSLAFAGGSTGSPILDAGLAIDFTLLPVLDLGIHTSYNTTLKDPGLGDPVRWLGLGAHVAIAF
jgi:hypothetical protein